MQNQIRHLIWIGESIILLIVWIRFSALLCVFVNGEVFFWYKKTPFIVIMSLGGVLFCGNKKSGDPRMFFAGHYVWGHLLPRCIAYNCMDSSCSKQLMSTYLLNHKSNFQERKKQFNVLVIYKLWWVVNHLALHGMFCVLPYVSITLDEWFHGWLLVIIACRMMKVTWSLKWNVLMSAL